MWGAGSAGESATTRDDCGDLHVYEGFASKAEVSCVFGDGSVNPVIILKDAAAAVSHVV